MIFNNLLKPIGLSLLLFAFFLPSEASAKLPPIDFATKRLLKNRVPSKHKIELKVLGKTITNYQGQAELFVGDFSVQTLKFSKDTGTPAQKLFAIAFGSQNVFEDFQTRFSKLDSARSVSVQRDNLTHRYGTDNQVSIYRDTGALAEIQVKIKGKSWKLNLSDLGPSRFGTVYNDGLVVMRFTIRKIK